MVNRWLDGKLGLVQIWLARRLERSMTRIETRKASKSAAKNHQAAALGPVAGI
jgi:hypothetical protein